MKSFLRQNAASIYSKNVVPIVIAITPELLKYFGLLPGMANMSFDRVTLNRKSIVVFLIM
jgi:hypothetical protein